MLILQRYNPTFIHKLTLLTVLGLSTIAFSSRTSLAREFTTEEKLSDLNQLATIMRAGYGPLFYKKERGLDLDGILANYSEKAKATVNNVDFYYLINQFTAEFQDSHLNASVPTGQSASLPFSTDLINGHVLIDDINRAILNESQFSFQKGDEIIEFDEKPITQVLNELARYTGTGYTLTSKRFAAISLTARSGTRFPVPTGEVKLKIRRGTSNHIEKTKLTWSSKGMQLDEAIRKKSLISRPGDFSTNYRVLSINDLWQDIDETRSWNSNTYRCSGTSRIAIPADAIMIMDTPFVAYYHPTKKGNIGYLRIPHYAPKNDKYEDDFRLRFAQYEYAVSILEKNTVGLIIDQDHNCGGSLEWLNDFMSLFMTSTFKEAQFQLLASKDQLIDLMRWLKEVNDNTLEHLGVENVAKIVKDAWESGDRMTSKISFSGFETREPNATHYTKPIVMLVDELSGSGGDMFPAMMKGHGRVKLLGTRTMGAGGHSIEIAPLSYSQINVRMTKSLFFRPDGVAVENNGTAPDYPYTPTRDDLLYEFKEYQAFYVSKLLDLIGKQIPVKVRSTYKP